MKKIKLTESLYPKRLKEIKNPPNEIYLLGDESVLEKTAIAIVGSRNCNNYGKTQTQRFASYLSEKNICIVSGLARGIDSIAHFYSKNKIGKTIAVIASGFNRIYPPENKKLLDEIINDGGCCISEWPPDTEIDMHRFPMRNRIISGISVGTLVVQAKYRSGSNITANYAIKQKREVFCIPGDITSPGSYGPNKLISEGANLVTSPEDIIQLIHYSEYNETENKVKPEYQEIYELIGTIPISANEISRMTKRNISEINEILLMLEIDNYIEQNNNGKYILKGKD